MEILILVTGCFIPPALLAWGSGWLVRRWAPRWGLVDRPDERKDHSNPTPLGGGLAIWLAVTLFMAGMLLIALVAPTAPWLPEIARRHLPGVSSQLGPLLALLGGATAMMALGLADDLWGLDWRWRLGVEFGVAAACVLSQGEDWQLTAFMPFPQLAWICSVLWIVALVNAFNMLDNMDGASAGVAIISSLMLVLYVVIPGATLEGPQLFVAGFLMVFVGALLGFLWHNRPPARIFMGDAGSYFVGFCIAIATLLATYTDFEGSAVHAIMAPVIIMAVPIYDLVTVMVIRIVEGRSLFKPDKSHFSHRLVELGLSRGRAVLTMYLTTATTGLAAILLQQVNLFGAILIILMTFCVLSLIAILENTARRQSNTDLGD